MTSNTADGSANTSPKPRILVANDDGIQAEGLAVLADALAGVGDVWVVAPHRERSGTSHTISLHRPLRVRQVKPRWFEVDGSPVDCVYVALHGILPGPPDIVVSGINLGANLGNDVLYSGTVGAAMEGALFGHRALAVSLCMHDNHDERAKEQEHFATAAHIAAQLVTAQLTQSVTPGVLLNVNVPNVPVEAVRGLKLCRLGYCDWAQSIHMRRDPRGRPYVWIGGERRGYGQGPDVDNAAVAAGYVSMTPLHYDLTDPRAFSQTRALQVDGLPWADDALGDDNAPLPRQQIRPSPTPTTLLFPQAQDDAAADGAANTSSASTADSAPAPAPAAVSQSESSRAAGGPR